MRGVLFFVFACCALVDFCFGGVVQQCGNQAVGFQAEAPAFILNPDEHNDIQNSVQTGVPESTPQVWQVANDPQKSIVQALQAPSSPHVTMDSGNQESIAVYQIQFAVPGNYYLYYRSRRSAMSGSASAFFLPAGFGVDPTISTATMPDARYHWARSSHTFSVSGSDVGTVLELRIGAGDELILLDAFVLSTEPDLFTRHTKDVLVWQEGSQDLGFQAEDLSFVNNADADDDVQNGMLTSSPETVPQIWAVVDDAHAVNRMALKAPSDPHDTGNPSNQEAIAVYQLVFATPGDYYLYYRSKDPSASGGKIFLPAGFDQIPDQPAAAPQNIRYHWAKWAIPLTVSAAEAGNILHLNVGVSDPNISLDAFVLSLDGNLIPPGASDVQALDKVSSKLHVQNAFLNYFNQLDAPHLVVPAADPSLMTNPDRENDVRNGSPKCEPELTPQGWTSTTLPNEPGYFLVAPSGFSYSNDPLYQEGVAKYRLVFNQVGEYYLYFRGRRDLANNSDEFFVSPMFNTAPTHLVRIPDEGDAGQFKWVQVPALSFQVTSADLGMILEFDVGIRNRDVVLDTFIFSTNPYLLTLPGLSKQSNQQKVSLCDNAAYGAPSQERDRLLDRRIFQAETIYTGSLALTSSVHLAFGAEQFSRIENPDWDNDVRNGSPKNENEITPQVWQLVTNDVEAGAGTAIQAPDKPQYTINAAFQESLAVYELVFEQAGDYYLYYRGKRGGDPGDTSFFMPPDFDSTPDVAVTILDQDQYGWRQMANQVFTVTPQQVGQTLSFCVGVRESKVVLDGFVFSSQNGLVASQLDRLCDPLAFQAEGVSHLLVQAEDFCVLENPDYLNDIRSGAYKNEMESPWRNWDPVPTTCDAQHPECDNGVSGCDPSAYGRGAIHAPAPPHHTQASVGQEGLALYNLYFREPGTYYLYYRGKNTGFFDFNTTTNSDTFMLPTALNQFPCQGVGVSRNGSFAWRKSPMTFQVTTSGHYRFAVGVYDVSNHLDAFAFSPNPNLLDDQLDGDPDQFGDENLDALFSGLKTTFIRQEDPITNTYTVEIQGLLPAVANVDYQLYVGEVDGGTEVANWGPPAAAGSLSNCTADCDFTTELSGLSSGTTYFARQKVTVNGVATWSDIPLVFTTHRGRPHIFIDSSSALQTRSTDPVYADEWNRLVDLADQVSALFTSQPGQNPPQVDDPTSPSIWSIRHYEDWLLAMALVAKADAAKQAQYGEAMQNLFMGIYEGWEPIWLPAGSYEENFDDLERMHAMRALMLFYDWHYELVAEYVDIQVFNLKMAKYMQKHLEEYERLFRDIPSIYMDNHQFNNYAALALFLYTMDEIPSELRATLKNFLEGHCGYEGRLWEVENLLSSEWHDGAPGESTFYDATNVEALLLWFKIYASHYGQDLVSGNVFFEKLPLYFAHMALPAGNGPGNIGGVPLYGDSAPNSYTSHSFFLMPLLAQSLNDPLTRDIADWLSHDSGNDPGTDLPKNNLWIRDVDLPKSYYYNGFDYLRFLNWEPKANSTFNLNQLVPWHLFSQQGYFNHRQNWSENASWFGMKSGDHYSLHAHPDDGQFIIHRAGVPYITDLGFEENPQTGSSNVLTIQHLEASVPGNGDDFAKRVSYVVEYGQYGDLNDPKKTPCDPSEVAHIGDTPFGDWPDPEKPVGSYPYAFAVDGFFDVIADPTPVYYGNGQYDANCEDRPRVDRWYRQAVGIEDLYFIFDTIDAGAGNDPGDLLALRFHSYVSQNLVEFDQHCDNPGTAALETCKIPATWRWRGDDGSGTNLEDQEAVTALALGSDGFPFNMVKPRGEQDPMVMKDLSSVFTSSWSSLVQPTLLEADPGVVVNQGNHLLKTHPLGDDVKSLMVFYFGIESSKNFTAFADGSGLILSGNVAQTIISWDQSGSLCQGGSGQLTLQGPVQPLGSFAVRRQSAFYYGRMVTLVESCETMTATTLLSSTNPVSVYAPMEMGEDGWAVIPEDNTTIRLFWPAASTSTQVYIDGAAHSASFDGGSLMLEFTIPLGDPQMRRLSLNP